MIEPITHRGAPSLGSTSEWARCADLLSDPGHPSALTRAKESTESARVAPPSVFSPGAGNDSIGERSR